LWHLANSHLLPIIEWWLGVLLLDLSPNSQGLSDSICQANFRSKTLPQLPQAETIAETKKQRFLRKTLPLLLLAFLFLCVIAMSVALHYATPYLHREALDLLQEKFHGDVQLADFHVYIYPSIHIEGTGLVVRHEGRTDVPPLISIREFTAEAGLLGFIHKPWKIERIQLKGLVIHIPPKSERQGRDWSKVKDIPILIHEITSDNAELHIIPKDPSKPEHVFPIRHLIMRSVGLNRAALFNAQLTNYKPPGEIDSQGYFGPWSPDDPGQTPLAAGYTFKNADLGVFKGIAGILQSRGKFGGVLESIGIEGETETPGFKVSIAGHPVDLKTIFSATVDGTNGDTLLHPVRATLLNTTIVCNGEVVKDDGEKGRTVALDVSIDNGRIEDLLRLAVKSYKPPLTGAVNLRTKFELPPGDEDVIRRLKLTGTFGVHQATFTDSSVNAKVEKLSRTAEGKPEDDDAGSGISNLKGHFALGSGVATFRNLSFEVPGADVQLDGTFGLADEKLDFHGTLRMKAKLSQTQTGIKSFLLKAVDPFFRKGDVTVLPIKITGTRDKPSFGLDLHHKDEAKK
jgi:AsmA-like C-terminal region